MRTCVVKPIHDETLDILLLYLINVSIELVVELTKPFANKCLARRWLVSRLSIGKVMCPVPKIRVIHKPPGDRTSMKYCLCKLLIYSISAIQFESISK